MTIIEAMADRELFAAIFKHGMPRGESWSVWQAFLSALFGLSLDAESLAIVKKHTGRADLPAEPFHEAFVIAGRRSGKSLIAALVAVFLSCFKNYDDVLAPGEVGTFMILAADRRQARTIFGYVQALLQVPMLKSMVVSSRKESIMLSNRVAIEIHTCSFKATRGYTLIGVIADELAFWSSEDTANPDKEVLNALRPGLATTNGLLLGISSPYAKRGALFEAYRDNFGKSTSVLVWKAASWEMNPTLSRKVVEAAYERDSASARAEFGAEFRDGIENFVSYELVESRVIRSRTELVFAAGVRYFAFVDPSGGSSDSMTLAVAHIEKDRAVLDLVRETKPPFSPETTVREFSKTLMTYRVTQVSGDHYAGEWPREQFRKNGIEYRPAELPKSEIYLELLPALTSGQVELLDNPRLIQQLTYLERRTARGGRDSVDHMPGGHDDVANAAAGALIAALKSEHTHGLIRLWERESKRITGEVDEVETSEDSNPRIQRAAIEEEISSNFKAAVVFGAQREQIVQLIPMQAGTVPLSIECPKCGNANLFRCGISGISGDVEETCTCGWSQIVKRVTSLRRR